MESTKILLLAAAFALPPAQLLAEPGGHGGGNHGAVMGQGAGASMERGATIGRGSGVGMTQITGSRMTRSVEHSLIASQLQNTQAGQGSTNGVGWSHLNGPSQTGQPNVECEEVTPGHAASAPGSAFNEQGTGHQHYAGEQPQNSRNTASVSQYDVACLNQPQP